MARTILSVRDLSKTFSSKDMEVRALNHLSLDVSEGETVGIVGESGCGKSTLGRCIVRAHRPTSGEILFRSTDGTEYDIAMIDRRAMKRVRREIQMIFQDPYSSLNPRMSVYNIIAEPLRANFKLTRSEEERRVKDMALKVGLNPAHLQRYPHAFSGGQRQRISIARALVFEPEFIVCDEVVSALDVSVQAQVINLLKDLQADLGLTYLFISHDLSIVEYVADKVGVMYLGSMVEYASTADLFAKPLHPYTEALLSAVPIADPTVTDDQIALGGEVPNPADPPKGCPLHPRCRYCIDLCRTKNPPLRELAPGRFSACHRSDELSLRGVVMSSAGKSD